MVKNTGFELNAMNYPLFSIGKSLNKEQKDFFREYGFLHFKNFVDKATVQLFIKESERIQQQWIKDDVKMVYGVPIKYGKDIDGSTIVQRFAFVNIYSDIFSDFLKDPRLESLFELIGAPDSRIGDQERDGLVINHYVNVEGSNYSQLGWHTDSLRDIFYASKVLPMLNVGVHLDNYPKENGGLRILPGTHSQGMTTMLFKKRYLSNKPDKDEMGLNVEAGDLTIHDGRIWHRVAQSPIVGEKSRRRVMYVPIISGKFMPKNENSRPRLYQRLYSYIK